jgi:4-phospho-D-threonate 3-dehydrogenase / 4-phospho-D-erythronate 3-dehydrogenase
VSDVAPHLAITMGDPAGVGPEIIVKACRRLQPRIADGKLRLLVIGHRSQLHAARALLNETLEFPETDNAPLGFLAAGEELEKLRFGEIAPEAGRFAYLAMERAVDLAMSGRIDAIVTAPLNKEALNLAGYHYAGHTDMLSALTKTPGSIMLLAHGDMRVGHVTTHVALADVPRLLTPERLRRTIDVTHQAVRDLGIAQPRVAVAALNPHAGEGGLFGRQDIEITTPVVEQCRAAGMDVTGPVPGDTVFVKLRARQFDAVVAMYHDQGHIPVKLLGFDVDPATGTWRALSGVNITLGLPVIRTSVDHGTAFDIAGKGVANEESLIEAIEYAERLAATKRAKA